MFIYSFTLFDPQTFNISILIISSINMKLFIYTLIYFFSEEGRKYTLLERFSYSNVVDSFDRWYLYAPLEYKMIEEKFSVNLNLIFMAILFFK